MDLLSLYGVSSIFSSEKKVENEFLFFYQKSRNLIFQLLMVVRICLGK